MFTESGFELEPCGLCHEVAVNYTMREIDSRNGCLWIEMN
jgi:hypothetical protein